MRIPLLLLLLAISFCASSQRKTIDSLWNRINNPQSEVSKVNDLNKLFNFYSMRDSDSAKLIADQAFKLSAKINYPLGKATAYNNIGTIHYYKGNNTKALSNYLSAEKVLEKVKDKIKNSRDYKKQLSISYNNIGTIYQRQKNYTQAENYFLKSIDIDRETGDKKGMAHCYNNLGTIKEENSQYDEAIKYYELALQLKLDINDTIGIPSTLINMGILRMNQKKFTESKDYFEKALKMARNAANKQDEALALINMGDMFFLEKEYDESLIYYKKGIEISKEQKYGQFLSYAYQSLSLSYYRMKNFEKAYDNYEKYVNIKDSLNSLENTKTLNEMVTKYESDVKEKEIKLLKAQGEVQDLEIQSTKTLISAFIGGLVLLVLLIVLLTRAYVSKRNTSSVLDAKNQKIEAAYSIIEQKQKEIVDSINYARRIQYTLLAHDEFLKANLDEFFILYKPKDIVSGDFYWATKQDNKFFLAVCDSTGHGVPGSFMSLLNIGFFSEAINEKGIYKPNEVLNYVRKRLSDTVSKEGQKDGFDGILLCIDKDKNTITYSAANNTPVLIENNNLKVLLKDKMPVGIGENQNEFTLFTIEKEKDAVLYLFTDGYADQFGGEKGKKFMYRRLEGILLEHHNLPLNEQAEILDSEFENWRGDLEQVDDVCVFGLRV